LRLKLRASEAQPDRSELEREWFDQILRQLHA
jgi:hypothetical protein